tara:strand:+ start:1612 stop:1788 length:177 start_codon:yes stop_codon:yes gene_type:complete
MIYLRAKHNPVYKPIQRLLEPHPAYRSNAMAIVMSAVSGRFDGYFGAVWHRPGWWEGK